MATKSEPTYAVWIDLTDNQRIVLNADSATDGQAIANALTEQQARFIRVVDADETPILIATVQIVTIRVVVS